MKWVYLFAAIILEVSGTVFMKLSEGFTKLGFSILMIVFYLASLGVLSLAIKNIDTSVAYAIWSGVGITLISVIGVVFLKESISLMKVVSILLIMAGIIGLKLSGVE
ncbi:small multidrug resistance protein [Ruminiclostridium papyrosolvens DSM 2782]|uniref:Small multidrug resistance protein n=1 Tax=Ruminiclostridium papyrosolvens DSM 2782 TaxID=588581 RepID=F1T740_9FIRM|nr:multidrug efflux SMR transporter [Ruminiclostridium papyrosolvens]EGD49288.1 small multidrug resistance protein [Ruminiclostridium papyrosolvens DSM 2782]WES33583.1 multidrug efflux SMR transporter [Ruminiclostridium papyrosolvens DSM 2782]